MKARLVLLATILDVVVLAGLGVGIFFAPLTLVWAFSDGFSTQLADSWAVAVQGWFLGHSVPLANLQCWLLPNGAVHARRQPEHRA